MSHVNCTDGQIAPIMPRCFLSDKCEGGELEKQCYWRNVSSIWLSNIFQRKSLMVSGGTCEVVQMSHHGLILQYVNEQ